MSASSSRRLRQLHAHLTSAAAPTMRRNVRPGDEDMEQVETSYFLREAFRPRMDESTVQFDLGEAAVAGAKLVVDRTVTTTMVGTVPHDLVGCFLRIGPNPTFDFEGKPYHVFDGDGMVHAVSFPPVSDADSNDGVQNSRVATYANRWVRTRAREKDDAQGFSFSVMGEASQIFETGSLAWVPYARDLGDAGRANTSLVWHAPSRRLLALFEQDKPYALDPATLETVGRVDAFQGRADAADAAAPNATSIRDHDKLTFPTFTAHPKVCAVTGDMIYFGYINGPRKGPWCHYGVIDGSTGKIACAFPVTLPAPVMMHDIAITTNYSLFYDYNLMYNHPRDLMSGKKKQMYEYDPTRASRFGVLPRRASSEKEIIWIETKTPCVLFHFATAFEHPTEGDGDIIMVYGVAQVDIDLDNLGGESSRQSGGKMHVWRLNVRTGVCEVDAHVDETMSGTCDFAQVPMDRVGRPIRYCYAATFSGGFEVDGVVKFDLQTGTHQILRYGPGVFGGESMFARRAGWAPGDGSDEDDGYLLSFTYTKKGKGGAEGEEDWVSMLDIVNAKTMQRVSRVAMPRRVPMGFHALWMPRQQLALRV